MRQKYLLQRESIKETSIESPKTTNQSNQSNQPPNKEKYKLQDVFKVTYESDDY